MTITNIENPLAGIDTSLLNDSDVISIPERISDTIKLDLMKYLRFEKQYECVCTEAVNNADVSAIKHRKLIEIEIKISKSDFRREFKKSWKHGRYKEITEIDAEWMKVPNKFFFCVPQEMEEWAVKEIDKLNIKYGLIVWQKGYVYVRRKAMHLHRQEINTGSLIEFCKRITSELINLKIKTEEK